MPDVPHDQQRPAGLPFAAYLSSLIWICMSPLVLLTVWLAFDFLTALNDKEDQEAAYLVTDYANDLDRFLDLRLRSLKILAASRQIREPGPLAEFYRQMIVWRQYFDGHVIFADRSLQMLLNTRVPLGTPLPRLLQPERDAVALAVLGGGVSAICNVVDGPVAGERLIALAVPVFPVGDTQVQADALLLSTFDTRQLLQLLEEIVIPPTWSVALQDSQGEIIVRHGQLVTETDTLHRFTATLKEAPWMVTLDIPTAEYRRFLIRSSAIFATVLLLTIIASLLGARWITRRLKSGFATLLDPFAITVSKSEVAEIASVRGKLMAAAEQRSHAETELKRALALIEASPTIGFRWQAASGWPVEYVSQNILRWGYAPEDLLSGRIAYGTLVHPDDIPVIEREVARNTTCGIDEYRQIYRVRAADGHYFWVEDHTHIVRDADGKLLAYEGVVRDIDERKRYELELAANLIQQKELNSQIEQAHSQLLQSEKMASIGQLAAGVAHELNNPIGYVSSNLGTLDNYLHDLFAIIEAYAKAEQSSGLHSAQFDQVHTMMHDKDYDFMRTDIYQLMAESRDGLMRVTKIVKDLKDFSRAGEAAMQWADLHQGLDSTLNIVHNELKYKCTVTKHYGNLPLIWCEPSHLNQVFMNLLVNAGHAISENGEITIRTGQQGDQVFVAITDNGCGIPTENLKRIFDPFFTTKPVGKGTGLGLSLSYSIVQKHSGRIEVFSEPGQGATFTVWLPIEPPTEAKSAVAPAPTLESS
jgi:PAS domain S-box-containing protein